MIANSSFIPNWGPGTFPHHYIRTCKHCKGIHVCLDICHFVGILLMLHPLPSRWFLLRLVSRYAFCIYNCNNKVSTFPYRYRVGRLYTGSKRAKGLFIIYVNLNTNEWVTTYPHTDTCLDMWGR